MESTSRWAHRRQLLLRILVVVAMMCVAPAEAGTIFDDDPIPPKSVDRSQAAGPTSPATAIPSKSDLTHSRKLLKTAYADQLKDRSISARRKLAETLLEESEKTGNSPADRFALITGAIDSAREGISLTLCMRAAEKLSDDFPVDNLKVETDAAVGMNLRTATGPDAADNVHAGLRLVDSLAEAEEFTDAFRVLGAIRPLAASDPELHALAIKHTQSLESTRAASEKIKPSLETLKTLPNDPAANLAVGEYYCLRLGQWEKGLPFLGKGSDKRLQDLAIEERAARTDPARALKLADAWWDQAEIKGTREGDSKAMKVHAATLYRAAKSAVTGLTEKVVDVRLQQAAKIISEGDLSAAHGANARGPAVFVNSFGMKFVRIEPGAFLMGSPLNEADRSENEKQHKVILTRGFYMAATLVTKGQWKAVMNGDRSELEAALVPEDSINFQRAMDFCAKLNETEGKQYRLPTEAEWEYACRAGTTTAYGPGKLDDFAWYRANSANHSHPVAQKKPNAWGLFDMRGEVWEWCSDRYGEYPPGPAIDPTGPPPAGDKTHHVLRGGSWNEGPVNCRSAFRNHGDPTYGDDRFGLRVCLEIGP